MCQSKSKGGKRCARHMNGSVASVRTCVILTGVEESFVGKVFTSLRQEGKNLPAPTKEDVSGYAKVKQFEAKFDPGIPDSKRKGLIQRWLRAEEDTPDGGTMHAWRNIVPATITRYNVKSVAAAGILASTLVLAGCGPATNNDGTPPPAPTEISSIATPDPSHTMIEGQNPSFPNAPFKVPSQFEANGTGSNSKGEYMKFKLKDSELQSLNESVLSKETKANFTKEELEAANIAQQKFITEYMIDNVSGGDSKNKEQFIKDMQESGYLAKSVDEWIGDEEFNSNFNIMHDFEDENGKKLDIEFYKDAPRVVDFKMELSGMEASPNDDNVITTQSEIEYTYVAKDKATGKSVFRTFKGSVLLAYPTKGADKGKVADYMVDGGIYESE